MFWTKKLFWLDGQFFFSRRLLSLFSGTSSAEKTTFIRSKLHRKWLPGNRKSFPETSVRSAGSAAAPVQRSALAAKKFPTAREITRWLIGKKGTKLWAYKVLKKSSTSPSK